MTEDKPDFKEKFKQVGALWDNKGVYSVNVEEDLEKGKYVAFKNKFKTDGDKQPDYRLFKDLQPEESKED